LRIFEYIVRTLSEAHLAPRFKPSRKRRRGGQSIPVDFFDGGLRGETSIVLLGLERFVMAGLRARQTWKCVAPTALGALIELFPNPYRLGYPVRRLWRWAFAGGLAQTGESDPS
jgi:hypothetical protein